MNVPVVAERLFLVNALVLIAHQIEAAYWHEWDMFYLPGGMQLFVLLNIPILFVVFMGYRAQLLGLPSAMTYTGVLAGCGLFAAVFHGIHLGMGDDRFTAPVSYALLGLTLVLSLAQVGLVVHQSRHRRQDR